MELNKIYNEDCLDGLSKLEDSFIDLVVTSPPYDNLRNYNESSIWNFEIFKPIARELSRVLKNGGVIVWNVNDATINGGESGTSFRQVLYFLDECGLKLHDTMIYEKTGIPFPAGIKSVRYSQSFEYCFVLSKGKPKSINLIQDKPNKWAGITSWGSVNSRNVDGSLNKTGKTKVIKKYGVRTNIWKINNQKGFGQSDNDTYEHPASMPEQLAKDHIMSWSNLNDVVLDPFAGSGTTLIQSHTLGRDYIGFEIDKEYYELCKKRLNKLSPFFDFKKES
jgi:site-specific DNA-methyltransferase (adenine-specific)